MSGSFEKLDVPPTLISFAVTNGKTGEVISPEFKKAGSKVVILKPEYDENMLPKIDSILALYDKVTELMRSGKVLSAYTPTIGGVAEAVYKMAIGNGFGFDFDNELTLKDIFGYCYGSFVLELSENMEIGTVVGTVTEDKAVTYNGKRVCMCALTELYENKLEGVYPCNIKSSDEKPETVSFETDKKLAPAIKVTKPKVLIPVFPGTNCEYDSAKAVEDAGAQAEIFVINNLSADDIKRSS